MKAEWQCAHFTGIIPASLTANSVLFAFRNPDTRRGIRLRRIEAMARTEVPPSGADGQFSLSASLATAFVANYTGGVDLSDTAAPAYFVVGPDSGLPERRAGVDPISVLLTGNVMIANTTGLATATPTIKAFPFAWDQRLEPVDTAKIDRPGLNLLWTPSAEAIQGGKGIILRQDTGFVIRNPQATGAGHTWRLLVRVAWDEQ